MAYRLSNSMRSRRCSFHTLVLLIFVSIFYVSLTCGLNYELTITDRVAASQANIPSVIISNFTFDSCYAYLSANNFVEEVEQSIDLKKLNDLVTIVTRDYSRADLLLRLPGPIPIPAFDLHIESSVCDWVDHRAGSFTLDIGQRLACPTSNRLGKEVIDIPLIVRPFTGSALDPQTKLALLSSLRVPSNLLTMETKILLVSFGGQVIPRLRSTADHNVDCQTEQPSPDTDGILPSGWIAIVCGLSSTALDSHKPQGFYSLSDSSFDYLPDLTAIADVVLGKLGYGTCSEVIAARTPFISVPRKKFLEEYGLKRLMKQHSMANIEMSIRDFEDGRWAKYIVLADQLGHQGKVQFLDNLREKNSRTKTTDSSGVSSVINHLDNFLSRKL